MKFKSVTEFTVMPNNMEKFAEVWSKYIDELVELYGVEHVEIRENTTRMTFFCIIEFDKKSTWQKFWMDREHKMKSYIQMAGLLHGLERRHTGDNLGLNSMKKAQGLREFHQEATVEPNQKPLDDVDFSDISLGQINVAFN